MLGPLTPILGFLFWVGVLVGVFVSADQVGPVIANLVTLIASVIAAIATAIIGLI